MKESIRRWPHRDGSAPDLDDPGRGHELRNVGGFGVWRGSRSQISVTVTKAERSPLQTRVLFWLWFWRFSVPDQAGPAGLAAGSGGAICKGRILKQPSHESDLMSFL